MTIAEILALDDFEAIIGGHDAALQRANDAQLAFATAVQRMETTQPAHDAAMREASAARDAAFAAKDEFSRWVCACKIISDRLDFLSQLESN